MTNRKIKILIADDSLTVRNFLVKVFSLDPGIEVIGTAIDGQEAIEFVKKNRPDIITMDINMPRLDGFEATLKIMQENPIPIVIVSGDYNTTDTAKTFKALECGAVAILPRPVGVGNPDFDETVHRFVSNVKLLSEVKVIRRWNRIYNSSVTQENPNTIKDITQPIRIITLGASAGGPLVLQQILKNIPSNISVPILIVQHLDVEFAQGYADWLNIQSNIPIKIAKDGDILTAGVAYMAPGNHHIGVKAYNTILVSKDSKEKGHRPSVAFMFRSVREVFRNQVLAIILSGMGDDGAEELKLLKDKGAITIAQDFDSSLIHGMPGEAIRIGAASYILSPDQIIQFIKRNVSLSIK
ncbi:MAG: chemotaxis-specific protein-glutamate methyltransferase CheB [Bacteroidetes bacterium]|nr:chemotaxis-specific protein-glutamate methyltransferase CheB [Bacteroidota bacterium]